MSTEQGRDANKVWAEHEHEHLPARAVIDKQLEPLMTQPAPAGPGLGWAGPAGLGCARSGWLEAEAEAEITVQDHYTTHYTASG